MPDKRRGRGEGSIYQLETGRWRGAVDLGWVNGRRRRYVHGATKAEVIRDMRRLVRQAEQGRLNADRTPTVAEWMERWLTDVAAATVRPTTLARYEQEVRLHVAPTLGGIRLDALRPEHIATLYQDRRADLSPSIRRLHAMIRRSLTIAVHWGLISTNPAQVVDPPALTRAKIRPFNREEAEQFRRAVERDRLAARWLIGLLLGLRQGEALGLTWDSLDFDANTITISHGLQQIGGEYQLTPPKTRRSARVLPMPTVVATALEMRREAQRIEESIASHLWEGNELDLVFTTKLGTPIERSKATERSRRCSRRPSYEGFGSTISVTPPRA